jgi:hypothetical protein
MHKVILINAAGTRTEHEFASINEAHGAVGCFITIILDGKVGYLEFVSKDSVDARFVETAPVFQFFSFAHLPTHLQLTSKWFYAIAEHMALSLPPNRERDKALDRLLEAKDAAVRAALAK